MHQAHGWNPGKAGYAHVCNNPQVIIAVRLNRYLAVGRWLRRVKQRCFPRTLLAAGGRRLAFRAVAPGRGKTFIPGARRTVSLPRERLGFALAPCAKMSSDLLARIKTCWWERALWKRWRRGVGIPGKAWCGGAVAQPVQPFPCSCVRWCDKELNCDRSCSGVNYQWLHHFW